VPTLLFERFFDVVARERADQPTVTIGHRRVHHLFGSQVWIGPKRLAEAFEPPRGPRLKAADASRSISWGISLSATAHSACQECGWAVDSGCTLRRSW
jgi:hypothetical protein